MPDSAAAGPEEQRGGDPSEPPEISDFSDLVVWAGAHNPGLAAAWQDARASVERTNASRANFPQPQVNFTAFLRPVETRVGPQRFILNASQRFPWPGQYSAASYAASASARVSMRRFEQTWATIVRDLRILWAQVASIEATRDVLTTQADLLVDVQRTLEARLSIGSSSYSQLARLALREAELREKVTTLGRDVDVLLAQLRAKAALPSDTTLPSAKLPADLPVAPDAQSVGAVAANNPDVIIAASGVQAAEANVDAVTPLGLPQFSVGLTWIGIGEASNPGVVDSGKDAVALVFGMSIPLFRDGIDGREEAARATAIAAEFRQEATALAARSQAETWVHSLERARYIVEQYEGPLFDTARSALDSSVAAYGVGDESLLDLLALERALLDYRIRAIVARGQAAVVAARLDYVLGQTDGPETAQQSDSTTTQGETP